MMIRYIKNSTILSEDPLSKPRKAKKSYKGAFLPEGKQPGDLTPTEKKYRSYRIRADKKEIPFEVPFKYIADLPNKQCVYCGDMAQSIDRIDSSKGYTMDNIQPACKMCNLMKYTSKHKEFIEQINKIYKHSILV